MTNRTPCPKNGSRSQLKLRVDGPEHKSAPDKNLSAAKFLLTHCKGFHSCCSFAFRSHHTQPSHTQGLYTSRRLRHEVCVLHWKGQPFQPKAKTGMLRITSLAENASSVTLKVEGSIASGSVAVLEQECNALFEAGRKVIPDFSKVRYVDHRGVEILKRLLAEDVRITNCPELVQELLQTS